MNLFGLVLVFGPVLALLAVPVAYLLLWGVRSAAARRTGEPPWCEGCGYSLAGLDERARCPECGRSAIRVRLSWRRWLRRREGGAPWCADCGYSLAGLSGLVRCPECASVKRQRAWPAGWVAPACVALSQCPALIGLVVVGSWDRSGQPVEPLFWLLLLAILFLPAALACWSAWVVTRAGRRWLSIVTLCVLAGLPFLAEAAMFMKVRSDFSDRRSLFHGLPTLVLCASAPVVTAASLAVFTVCGSVAAAVMACVRGGRA